MHELRGIPAPTNRACAARPRLLLDVSALMRWVGPPVGIVRVEAELARYAMEHRPDVEFVAYDGRAAAYRLVKRHLVPCMIAGELFVDQTGVPDPRSVARYRLGALLSQSDRRLLLVRRPRRAAILALEALRTKVAPRWRAQVESVQSLLFNDRYRRMYFDADGRRREVVGFTDVLEERLPTLNDATILCSGFEWNIKNPDHLRDLKERERFRLVMVCYDLIPILYPQYFLPRDGEVFSGYFRKAVAFVDKFICISDCTARDLARFVAEQGVPAPDISVEHPGYDLHELRDAPLPHSLQPRRYALYVSTIEPRKNHQLVYGAWQRLLDHGIPQKHGFELVFVGRPGWTTDPLLQQLKDDTQRGGRHLQYFPDVSDRILGRLYRDAAFCLYPSRYEGYGLPIAEAFGHGRAVIASNAGSIPEVVQDMSPSLDPMDEDAWYRTLRQWIEEPAVVAAYEAKIAKGFVPRPWAQVAERYLAEAERARA
jgi:glycosyltransferase involved in cell wall biosynthesis